MLFELPEKTDDLSPEEIGDLYQKVLKQYRFREAELKRLRDENKFLLAAIENIPNALFIKDEDGCIVQCSEEFGTVFGQNIKQITGITSLDLDFFSRDECIQFREEDEDLLSENGIKHYEKDFEFGDGQRHPCFYWSKSFDVPDTNPHLRGIVSEFVDMTDEKRLRAELSDSLEELKRAKDEIEMASKIDPGTGLFNRYVFDAQTKDIINDARANDTPVSVMMCDLDHFKRVNDTFGHLEGDRVLKDFAAIIKSHIRAVDVPIRYGGEEFLVFLPGTDLNRARLAAERLRETTERQMVLPDGSHLTVSIGLVKFNPEETRTQCIERADEALYTAKETGRNKVVVYAGENEQYMG